MLGKTIEHIDNYTIDNDNIHFKISSNISKGSYLIQLDTDKGIKIQNIVLK
jgi:hypothetical protein